MLPLTCMLVCRFVCADRTRAAGAASTRSSLRPLISESAKRNSILGRDAPRAGECMSTRHCERSVLDTSPEPEPVTRRASAGRTARPVAAMGGAEQSHGTRRPFRKQITAERSDYFLCTHLHRNRDDLISTYGQPTN